MMKMSKNGQEAVLCGAVVVAGAGIAGIQASLDLSAAGFRVYLVEESAAVGGRMTRLDKTFPTGDCATCIVSPKLVECIRDINIDLFTLSRITAVEGEAGNFTVTLQQQPRYVNLEKCTGCGECTAVCPVEVPDSFAEGLGMRKAIDKLYAQAAPNANFISKKHRAPCSSACPIDHSVQAYVTLIARGKVKEAAALIRRENPLPSVCGRVCFHPCETQCNRGSIDAPLSIRNLKRYALDSFPGAGRPQAGNPTGKKVAVIGSGPAGLAAAHNLAVAGHAVKVFESLPVLGGMLAVGIPDYRLPPDILAQDLADIRKLGVILETGAAVSEPDLVTRLTEEYDAVFIATGAHRSLKLNIPGEETGQVIAGIDFLRSCSLGHELPAPEHAVIIGGGNTAIDAARTVRRHGSGSVTILYRRSRQEMPAAEDEVQAALAEGIRIEFLSSPVEVQSRAGKVSAVKCIKMKLSKPERSGRRRPVPVAGSEYLLDCDLLIPAVSQSPETQLAALLKLEHTQWGTLVTSELTLATSRPGIFAGGDVVLGPASVIEAIAQGKRAAMSIDNYLHDRPREEGLRPRRKQPNPLSTAELLQKRNQLPATSRMEAAMLPIDKRQNGFAEVELTYTDQQAQQEAARCLNCADCCECKLCEETCKAGAVLHSDKQKVLTLQAGAILLTPGFTAFDPVRKLEYASGYARNIITNTQFERLLSASGPTCGAILRPSDLTHPRRLAFIQCVGSRDAQCGHEYCSSVCCMVAVKEAILAREHEKELEVTVFYMDLRAFGKDFDRYYERALQSGVRFIRCRPSAVEEDRLTNNLSIAYLTESNAYIKEDFDLVVLSLGLEPSASLQANASVLGIKLNPFGFAQTAELTPLNTSLPGIFVGGAFQEPKDIPDTVMQASAAAGKVMSLLAPVRGSLLRSRQYPRERDITDEPPRIGVFICHCGSNIASVVDVEQVVKTARKLPHVVYADNQVYVCADDSQDVLRRKIAEHNLNRIVVASCTPRTHEPIFRDTLRAAGLNQYLLEMANIRDQCSWVHSANPEQATAKASDLVRMTVGRAAGLQPLKTATQSVKKAALVIGGGIAGMTAALALADQGFPVHLVEKEEVLGGTLRQMYRNLAGDDLQVYLATCTRLVSENPKISLHLQTKVQRVEGHIGEFKSTLLAAGRQPVFVEHGVVILATGATERKPQSFGYGKNPRVVTQLGLAELWQNEKLPLDDTSTVVMIQCVEQRNDEHPYCSRVCCASAVKNALQIKDKFPGARVIVFYRDMRTYGFKEIAYREARAKGVLFIRYNPEHPPVVVAGDNLQVSLVDPLCAQQLQTTCDLLVLAAPVVPRQDREELSELLRVALNADGFFVEAHVKLRPVDFASEGLFLCGTVHAPKFISETISQATAVAGRAAGILSRQNLEVSGQTAWVDQDKCIACMTCVHVCPYNAPLINRHNKAEMQGAVCMGCGSCTAECPARAITLRNYTDKQILNSLEALLLDAADPAGGRPGYRPEEAIYPELAGITPPRWHKE